MTSRPIVCVASDILMSHKTRKVGDLKKYERIDAKPKPRGATEFNKYKEKLH